MDEKTSLYPPSAPANAGKEGAPPSYGTEVNQPTRVVYVQAPRQPEIGPPVNDYFGLSLFTLLCCFWPLGLVALLKSVEVRRHIGDGRYEDAKKASRDAYLFNKIGIIIGCISYVILAVVIIANIAVRVAFSSY